MTFATVRREIADRIRRVCEHFSDSDFCKLVDRMAEIEVRYRLRTDWGLAERMSRRVGSNR